MGSNSLPTMLNALEKSSRPGGSFRLINTSMEQGTKHTEESKAKMSASHIGNNYRLGQKCSDETKAKMSAASKGKPKSPEHIAAMVVAKLGKKRGTYNKSA